VEPFSPIVSKTDAAQELLAKRTQLAIIRRLRQNLLNGVRM
jgi:hypothetical protein